MYTYIIESQGLYKIGRAIDLEKRLRGYKTHNPSFKVVKVIDGDYEKELHHAFKKRRSHLEWYKLDLNTIENIEKYINYDERETERAIKLRETHKKYEGLKIRETATWTNIVKSAKYRNIILSTSTTTQRMWMYIIMIVGEKQLDEIKLDAKTYKAEAGVSSINTYKKAIDELIKNKLIRKTSKKNIYQINQAIIYPNKGINYNGYVEKL